MGSPIRIGNLRNPNETMRLVVTIFVGAVVGVFLGVSFSTISLTMINLPSTLFPSIDLSYMEEKYSGFSTQALLSARSSSKGNKQCTEKYVSQETQDLQMHIQYKRETEPKPIEGHSLGP